MDTSVGLSQPKTLAKNCCLKAQGLDKHLVNSRDSTALHHPSQTLEHNIFVIMSGSGLPHDQTKGSGENSTVIIKYSLKMFCDYFSF